MRDLAVRGLRPGRAGALALSVTAAASACGTPPPLGDDDAAATAAAMAAGAAYLGDRAARRAALEASLAGVDNGYARVRRARYATGDGADWERLPIWNPHVQPVALAELDGAGVRGDGPFAPASATAPAPRALELPPPGAGAATPAPAALRALGEAAFFAYPAQLLPAAAALARADLPRYGLWSDAARGAGGLVRAEMADGSARLAYTCATCHAGPASAAGGATLGLVVGLGNAAFDLGAWLADTDPAPAGEDDPRLAWGRGRADVATAGGRLPVALPDLRPARFLTHLHYEATVAQRDLASLAIRLETLLITAHGQALRPPREIALGLAWFLWSLAGTLPAAPPPDSSGGALFGARCAGCHAGPGLTGAPVPAATVGTDPSAALDPERGTGGYRVPSLRGVTARGRLLHDGSVASVEELLDPARTTGGHAFGHDLPPAQRAQLAEYLRAQ